MRRIRQQISKEEYIALLKKERRGVLAMHGGDNYPYAISVNFLYEDGKIYFHGAKQGHKIDAIHKDNKVCFHSL